MPTLSLKKLRCLFLASAFIYVFLTPKVHSKEFKIVIEHEAVKNIEEEKDLELFVVINNVHMMKKLLMVYRPSGYSQFITKECYFDEDTTKYRCEIDSDDIPDSGLDYYLAVLERSGKSYPVFMSAGYPQKVTKGAPADIFSDPDSLESEFAVFSITDELVVSAARHEQKISEAPAAITVISEKDIRLTGIRFIPDLLRRVPGMDVMVTSRSEGNVSARGYNQLMSNKTLPLINGRNVYQDFFGATEWSIFSFNYQDIKQIEVIRGPGGALYGANAFSGVINIIGKKPEDDPGLRASLQYGSKNTFLSEMSFAEVSKKFKYRVSLGFETKDKWVVYNNYKYEVDKEEPEIRKFYDDITFEPAFEEEVGFKGVRLNSQFYYDFTKKSKLSFSAGISDAFGLVYTNDLIGNFGRKGLFSHIQSDYNYKDTKFRFFWNRLSTNTGREYKPKGQDKFVHPLRSNVLDFEVQDQKKIKTFKKQNIIYGASIRYQTINMKLFDKPRDQTLYAIFLQDEISLSEPLILTLSYRLDYHPRLKEKHAPRANLTYLIDENNTIRGSVGVAYRNPTFLENFSEFYYNIYNSVDTPTSAFTFEAIGNPELKPEKIVSYEAGIISKISDNIQLNFDLFFNNVDNIIAPLPAPFDKNARAEKGEFVIGSLKFVNEGTLQSWGGESAIKYNPTSWISLYGNYSFIRTYDIELDNFRSETPKHKINLGAQMEHKSGWEFSSDFHFVSQTRKDVIYLNLSRQDLDTVSIKQSSEYILNSRVGYWIQKKVFLMELVGFNILQFSMPRIKEHPLTSELDSIYSIGLVWTPKVK